MEGEAAMDFDEEAPLVQAFKRKRKPIPKKKEQQARPGKPPDVPRGPDSVQLPADAQHLTTNAPPEIAVSEFDYSVENHFKAVDTIAKLCGYPETLDVNQPELKRLSGSITFLREWRDFKYTPRVVRFAYQHNSKEKDVIGEVTLPQFSAASVPKKETQNGSEDDTESSIKDFIMHAGGAVWALDWCPFHCNTENHIKSEVFHQFVAVAAHPPESSYHKIGAPLTGRGVVQIWCLLTVSMNEEVPSQRNKRSRQISKKKEPVKANEPTKPKRPRGRPRKRPLDESVEKIDNYSDNVQPVAIEYPTGTSTLHPSDTVGTASEHVHDEDYVRTHKDSNCLDHPNALMLASPEGRGNKAKAQKEDHVHNNGLHVLRQCDHGESTLVNQPACAGADKNVTCNNSCDPSNSKISIPLNVALPRMILCLAHNGKVVWDLKWQPVHASDPESMIIMGYLAVLLGNGALEVWEVPLPHTVRFVFPACQERIDPRFIKLRPVFRCSMLKCGDRQSIPLTLEWSVSSPHDMILAGCHDGVVALWKFSVTDPLTETRPLLSFSADTGPVRSLAWAPVQGELESANVIITTGPKGFKVWDIRDPFRPLWDHHIPGVTYGLEWLPDPRCVFGSIDDGTLWLLSLERAAHDIPVTGKSITAAPKHGFHSFDCSSFSIWCIHASRLTGMVAYCGEEGTTFCFQPTTRSVRDPSRNRLHHYLCGSLLEEETALIVASPSTSSFLQKRSPGMKRSGGAKDQEKRVKEQMAKSVTCNEPPTPAICWSDHVEEHGSDKSSMVIKKQASKPKESSKTQSQANQETVLCRSEDAGQLQREGSGKEEKGDTVEVFPPKIVAMHRVRWNVNKGREKWLCYGGAAGLVRCQEVDFSVLK
ncbi:uncharacterized protein LOC105174093 isoform X1 [Sesamum indicum]|uniref:Uncharacterized protein LOC105174093 isoform X1 n=1 Tax=Sesamum indicum TaxID=4182 RepID=A0A6I9U9H9_SESIN|nr:uncharacterized protein LOC105174093 isoform X1 [Sesamum indicum]